MVTTLPNSTWNNKREVQTGNIGEELVYRFFEEHGYVIYNPRTDEPHVASKRLFVRLLTLRRPRKVLIFSAKLFNVLKI
ncbi:MAG: hypothetical protein IJQ16_03270 [Selenomonadaceae bacterium]|nr:hypothetical protein [Selenomonadaceae bacterium]